MRVLLATDGSDPSKEASKVVSALFDRSATDLHIFTVGVDPLEFGLLIGDVADVGRIDLPSIDAAEVAGEVAKEMSGEGFSVSAGSATGDPARRILEEAESGGYDLIVLGASHTSWMGNLLLGSVSTYVLHHSPVSVLIAHRSSKDSTTVVFGTDGSGHSRRAIDHAMSVLDPSRCSITVTTVVRSPWMAPIAYPSIPAFGNYPERDRVEKEMMDRAWEMVELMRAYVETAGFEARATVLEGATAPQLLQEAENLNAGLIVVGTRGRGAIKRALLGSVSDPIARHAPAAFIGRQNEDDETREGG